MNQTTGGGTPSLAGWLWADILLGLFVIFLAASSAPFHATATASPSPTPTPTPTPAAGLEAVPFTTTLLVNGPVLLGTDTTAVATEQLRIATEVTKRLTENKPNKRVPLILAYGKHEEPLEGDRLVKLATALLDKAPWADKNIVIKGFHELIPGDRGSTLTLEIYLYER